MAGPRPFCSRKRRTGQGAVDGQCELLAAASQSKLPTNFPDRAEDELATKRNLFEDRRFQSILSLLRFSSNLWLGVDARFNFHCPTSPLPFTCSRRWPVSSKVATLEARASSADLAIFGGREHSHPPFHGFFHLFAL